MLFLSTSVLLCGFNMRPCNGASCIMIKTCNNFSLIYVQIVLEFTLQLSVFLTTGFNCELLKLMFELRCLNLTSLKGFLWMHEVWCMLPFVSFRDPAAKDWSSNLSSLEAFDLWFGAVISPPPPCPTISLLWEMVEQVLLTGFRAFQPEADTWHG